MLFNYICTLLTMGAGDTLSNPSPAGSEPFFTLTPLLSCRWLACVQDLGARGATPFACERCGVSRFTTARALFRQSVDKTRKIVPHLLRDAALPLGKLHFLLPGRCV